MRILVTNDDGIYSPGIAALAGVAAKFGEVTVVAPNVEQSSMGHAITSSRPLSYKKVPSLIESAEAYKVNGTPADCVALGTHLIDKIDIVLSGINMGPNLGNAIWHSGTLAAAKQATLLGLRGIAFSTPTKDAEPDFELLEPYIASTLSLLLEEKDMKLVNVNFPYRPAGVKWTRQSVQYYDGYIVPGEDPMGRKHYWFTIKPLEPAEKGSDRWALENGFVSITPLRLDLTSEEELSAALKKHPVPEVVTPEVPH
ncbi:5'/3'-nucleotidase SurE [Ravibacter arvi]|uniref:5'-nucleotidase SurE n=1 Tax=Ravibacter arvi TaxID=2051041 RepID=A0ABP8LY22_9BACT